MNLYQIIFPQYSHVKELRLNPITLSFSNDLKNLETPFLEDYFDKYLGLFRACHFFSIFFYGIFSVFNYLVFSTQTPKHILWFVTVTIIVPMFLAGFLLTFHGRYKKWWPVLNNFYVVTTGSGFLAVMLFTPPPLNASYYVGVIICLVFGYTFIRSRFMPATIAGWILFVLYVVVSIAIDTPHDVLMINLPFMLVVNVLGMLICYSLEISDRKAFFLRHLLGQEQEKVRCANEILEAQVKERTQKLSLSNQRLSEEIKERKELESRLVQAMKMEALGSLAGGIAHDFNNILHPIIGFTELSLLKMETETPISRNLTEILKAAMRAKELVSHILAFSRKSGHEKKTVLVQSLVREVLRLLRPSIPSNIEICTDLDETAGPVLANGIQIHQVLMNLCANAAQAMEETGGGLDIGLRESDIGPSPRQLDLDLEPGRYIELMIRDTGPGIDPVTIQRIFDPYFTTKPPGKGSGMGLSVAHGIIKEHKGDIRVESLLGRGTVFYVYIPRFQEEAG